MRVYFDKHVTTNEEKEKVLHTRVPFFNDYYISVKKLI